MLLYKVQIAEHDDYYENKMCENEILAQFSLPSGLKNRLNGHGEPPVIPNYEKEQLIIIERSVK